MAKFAAFLRGMNVGGHRIKSDELQACFEKMGLHDVACFRASGNVIFAAENEAPDKLISKIEKALQKSLGYTVPIFLRTAQEMRKIAQHEPFTSAQVKASKGKLQVVLLLSQPSPKARKDLLALATDQDRLALVKRELYSLLERRHSRFPAGFQGDPDTDRPNDGSNKRHS